MKRFKKASYFFIAFSCLLSVVGFGCQGLSQSQKQATKPVNLEYWTVYDDVDALQKLINEYQVARPYLKVKLRQLRADEIYPRLLEALAEDRGPDIISVSTRSLGTYLSKLGPMPASVPDTIVRVESGTLGQTTTVVPQTQALPNLTSLDNEYVQTIKKDVVRGGQIYGLPLSLDTMAIFYNKDLLDRANIAEPPKTWDEFQADVKKITKYDKSTGAIIQSGAALGSGRTVPGSDDLLAILFKQSGVDMVDQGGKVVFNAAPQNNRETTAAMGVLNFYTDFANPTRDTYAWSDSLGAALDNFVAGKAGFFFGYSFNNAAIRARAPQLNFRIMPLLQLSPDHPVNVANYHIQSVLTKSKHQDAAWGLINFLTHSPATKEYLDQTGRPTAIRKFISDQQEKEDLKPFVSQLLVADNWYHGNNYEAAQRALNDMLSDWLQTPPDPNYATAWRQDILNRAAERINQTL